MAVEALAEALPAGSAPFADVYDTGGRRIATVALSPSGARWSARMPAATTAGWPGGVYFVRVRGQERATRMVVLR